MSLANMKRHHRGSIELGGLGGDHYRNRKDKMFAIRMAPEFCDKAHAFLSSRDGTKKSALEKILQDEMDRAGWKYNGPK